MKRFFRWIWKYLKPFTNWKFLIAFGLAWMITNGWCYIFIVLGPILKWNWMTIAGTAYAAFLYFPFTVEKIVTIPLAMFFQRILFPHDEKLRQSFLEMKAQALEDWNKVKSKFKRRKK